MVEKLSELRKLSNKELEERYDAEAQRVGISLSYFRDEILRREQLKQTNWLIALTVLVFIATVVSVIGIFIK